MSIKRILNFLKSTFNVNGIKKSFYFDRVVSGGCAIALAGMHPNDGLGAINRIPGDTIFPSKRVMSDDL